MRLTKHPVELRLKEETQARLATAKQSYDDAVARAAAELAEDVKEMEARHQVEHEQILAAHRTTLIQIEQAAIDIVLARK